MKNIIIRILIFIGAVYLASRLIPDISYSTWQALIFMGVVLAVAHITIKPIIKVITLPISILTFGLFSLVIHGILFWFVGNLIPGFSVVTFVAAFWGGLIVSITHSILGTFLVHNEN